MRWVKRANNTAKLHHIRWTIFCIHFSLFYWTSRFKTSYVRIRVRNICRAHKQKWLKCACVPKCSDAVTSPCLFRAESVMFRLASISSPEFCNDTNATHFVYISCQPYSIFQAINQNLIQKNKYLWTAHSILHTCVDVMFLAMSDFRNSASPVKISPLSTIFRLPRPC